MHKMRPAESEDAKFRLDYSRGFGYSVATKQARKAKGGKSMARRNKNVKGNTIHVKTKLIDTFIKMKIGGFTDAELKAIGDKISEIVAQNDPKANT